MWRNPLDAVDGVTLDDFPDRARCLDLSRVHAWADNGGIERSEGQIDTVAGAVAADIDPLFKHPLSAQETATAKDWIHRLIRVVARTDRSRDAG